MLSTAGKQDSGRETEMEGGEGRRDRERRRQRNSEGEMKARRGAG